MAHVERAYQGNTNDWCTPPEIVNAMGTFDLDPCGCPGSRGGVVMLSFVLSGRRILTWPSTQGCDRPSNTNCAGSTWTCIAGLSLSTKARMANAGISRLTPWYGERWRTCG